MKEVRTLNRKSSELPFQFFFFSYMIEALCRFPLLCVIPLENPYRVQLHSGGDCCDAHHLWSFKHWMKSYCFFPCSDMVMKILYFHLPIFHFYGWLKEFPAC